MKVIGPRGYTILKEDYSNAFITNLKKELTVKPFVSQDYSAPSPPFPVYCESKRKLYMPRFFGINSFGNPDMSKLNDGVEIDIEFKGKLRPIQLPIIDTYMKYKSGIVSVPCGYGKTVLALDIIARLKVKTLVIVHKEFLMNQWKERIEQFLPDARVGRIQSNKVKVKDKDIVLGMLQSISMIDYPEETFSEFGFVIYDECHHLGAEIFSRALLKTGFKYLLGLSATPKRSDGLSKVFQWYLGKIVYSIKREPEKVKVKIIEYYNKDNSYSKEVLNQMGKPNSATMINNITQFEPRLKLLMGQIFECLKDGRKILVLSDRRDHLKDIFYQMSLQEEFTYGFYLGGMKQSELQETETKDVILGTFTMASEGFDCKYPLNTIILSSPKTNIEQAVGRILREEESKRKKIPLVIDIADNFSVFARQKLKRIKYYKKNKYTIEKYDENNVKIMEQPPQTCEKELTFLD